MKKPKVNKKIGGTDRAKIARTEIKEIFSNPKHPLYLIKDIDLAKKYDVIRHTIYKIRDEMNIPSRPKRIVMLLKNTDTGNYTLKELSQKTGLKYQNIYKIMNYHNLPYKTEK